MERRYVSNWNFEVEIEMLKSSRFTQRSAISANIKINIKGSSRLTCFFTIFSIITCVLGYKMHMNVEKKPLHDTFSRVF